MNRVSAIRSRNYDIAQIFRVGLVVTLLQAFLRDWLTSKLIT